MALTSTHAAALACFLLSMATSGRCAEPDPPSPPAESAVPLTPVSDADRAKIQAALPEKAPVEPRRARKLLVFDLNVGYPGHPSMAHANCAVQLMGAKTRAYETVFSRDPRSFAKDSLKRFDAVFLNNTVGNLFTDPDLRASLLDFVKRGGGLLGVHGTSVAFTRWPGAIEDWSEFGEMLGGRGARHRESDEKVFVRVESPGHPLVAPFPAEGFEYRDEFFRVGDPYSRDRVRVLLSIDTARSPLDSAGGRWTPERADGDYALAWVRSYEKGRVFYSTIAHNPSVFWDARMLQFYLRAIQFALGDLPAPTTPSARLETHDLAGYKFLVTSVRTGDTEVFIVNPATGDAFNASRSPRSEDRYPCWSPDGERIAFISDRSGSPNLYVMDADGGNVRRLLETKAVCYMPSWVGRRIVFGMHGDKPEMASVLEDGTGLQILGDGHDPCLSPDGAKIAYTGEVPGGVTVFVMSADGGDKHVVVPQANPFGAVFPSWSPEGRWIVFSSKAGEGLELFVVGADGKDLRQLTRFGGGKVSTPAAWSDDGRWISFRLTDEMYWRDKGRMEKVYAEKPADKRPVWVIRPDGSDAHVVETLRCQMAIDGSRAAWKPARKFPTTGALPDRFPATESRVKTPGEDVYVIEEPRRSLEQVRALRTLMPGGDFPMRADRWRHLPETRKRLLEGGKLHIVNLGDSIVNDTARSAWLLGVRERYPRSEIRMTTVVRGSTGCGWYREENRIEKLLVPLAPDLVFIGGLSQKGDVDSFREVIRQIRALTRAEIIVGTAAFGAMDPLDPATLEREPNSGYAPFGRDLELLSEEAQVGFVDVTASWAEYVRRSGERVEFFKRDAVHANSMGEQVLGRIFEAFFAPD